jgi:hypothetical protein
MTTAFAFPLNSLSSADRARLVEDAKRVIAEAAHYEKLERDSRKPEKIALILQLMKEYDIKALDLGLEKKKAEPIYLFEDVNETTQSKRLKSWNGRGIEPKWLDGREVQCLIDGKSHVKSIADRLAAQCAASTPVILLAGAPDSDAIEAVAITTSTAQAT